MHNLKLSKQNGREKGFGKKPKKASLKDKEILQLRQTKQLPR